jgi:hypothetical protein
MKYTINYTGLNDRDKFAQAILDVQDYLGEARFNQLVALFKAQPQLTLEEFKLALSFAGITGYPAEALFDYCFKMPA